MLLHFRLLHNFQCDFLPPHGYFIVLTIQLFLGKTLFFINLLFYVRYFRRICSTKRAKSNFLFCFVWFTLLWMENLAKNEMSAGVHHRGCNHSQSSRCPEGLCILLHTRCGSSPWGSSRSSDRYTAERTPS